MDSPTPPTTNTEKSCCSCGGKCCRCGLLVLAAVVLLLLGGIIGYLTGSHCGMARMCKMQMMGCPMGMTAPGAPPSK